MTISESESKNEKNNRVYLEIYDYETKEFSGLTTYHGLVRIYNSNTWPSRIFWSVVVLSCLSLFMIHSGYLLLGYHSKPTLFQINTIVPENGIIFPDVTICNLNPYNFTKAKEMYKLPNRLLTFILHFYPNSFSTFDEEFNLEDRRNYQKFVENYYSETGKNFSVPEFLKTIGKSCQDTIISCNFGRAQYNQDIDCCEDTISELTDFGLCFRIPNINGKFRQTFGGERFGWDFLLNGQNFEKDSDPLSDSRGFLILLHENEKFLKIETNAISVPPNEMLHAGIMIKNISLLERDNWGDCQKNWKGNQSHQLVYTSTHCETMCEIQNNLDFCECIPLPLLSRLPSLPNIPICDPVQLDACNQRLKGNSNCTCDTECELLQYDTLVSYSELSRRNQRRFGFTDEFVSKHVSAASLYLQHVSYERHEQQKQLQTADLLSNIAGSMGLFLGMSTVTLLEIFIYLFKSVWGTVNSNRQRQFVKAVEQEELERQQSLVIIQDSGTEDEPLLEEEMNRRQPRLSRKHSTTPIHIHLDRRNSRMVLGGDLFSNSRGSVSIPSQILSPLSKHRKSISNGQLAAPATTIPLVTSGGGFGEVLPTRKKSLMRRSSTVVPPTFHRKRNSSQLENPREFQGLQRKASVQSPFKSQLL